MACPAYTCLDVCKNHLLVFSSFLDIWENVEWPRFFGPPGRLCYCTAKDISLRSLGSGNVCVCNRIDLYVACVGYSTTAYERNG